MRRKLASGNWKMNTTTDLAAALASALASGKRPPDVDVLLFPPAPYLALVASLIKGTGIELGGQNCYHAKPGAFTGEISIEMLKDVGCGWVLAGHSERRHILGETDAVVAQKASEAITRGLSVVLCVGETLGQREAKQTEAVLDAQLEGSLKPIDAAQMAHVVIAYEPVWAIGTGVVATTDQAESAHAHLRSWLARRYNSEVAEQTRILYGGSVTAKNAHDLMSQPNVDGVLVGGASLKSGEFLEIIAAGAAQ